MIKTLHYEINILGVRANLKQLVCYKISHNNRMFSCTWLIF